MSVASPGPAASIPQRRTSVARVWSVALVAGIALIVCGTLAQHGAASARALAPPDRSRINAPLAARIAPTVRPRLLSSATRTWSSLEATSLAMTVSVRVSPSYDDAGAAERWAQFLFHLVHGTELDGLTLYLGTAGEVAAICGIDTSGCYGSDTSDIVSIGDATGGVRPEAVVTHEYGHYIAAHRDNAPWKAVDWGTKRWATLLNVCAAVKAKAFFPGNQLLQYARNPGEGFAEAYRVLNGERFGVDPFGWPIAHRRFMPTAKARAAIRADVLDPWIAATDLRQAGRLDARGRAAITLSTPLDGMLALRVDGATIGSPGVARRTICGARSTVVKLTGKPGSHFVLTGSRP